jgi:uncharacterized membrane protein YczE
VWTTERLAERLARLLAGLVLYGVSLALMVRAGLGLGPWDVLHEGLAKFTGIGIGWIVNLMGLVVLALWLPLRQRPGPGTVANVLLVGFSVTATLAVLPPQTDLVLRIVLLVLGIVLTGVATGLYVGAGLGPGPRDGLMTGLAARGMSIAVARTVIELSVLALGYFAGGTVGVGTVLFALGIGPLAHYFLPLLAVRSKPIREETNEVS